jgi:hypothetical protein
MRRACAGPVPDDQLNQAERRRALCRWRFGKNLTYMIRTPARLFVRAVATVLIITGAAKVYSVLGPNPAPLLLQKDPIFGIQNNFFILAIALLEFAIAIICLKKADVRLQAAIVAWFSLDLLIYRGGLMWTGYQKPCTCLGSILQNLGVEDKVADVVLWTVAIAMVFGASAILGSAWKAGALEVFSANTGPATRPGVRFDSDRP